MAQNAGAVNWRGRPEGMVPGAWDETDGRDDVPNAIKSAGHGPAQSYGGLGSRPESEVQNGLAWDKPSHGSWRSVLSGWC